MQSLKPPFNPELLEIVNDFKDKFFKIGIDNIIVDAPDQDKPDLDEYYTSKEYLEVMQNKTYENAQENGWPETTYGINISMPGARVPKEMKDLAFDIDRKLNAFFMTKFSAVNMFYPKNGFMGWHNNSNCPGWNVLISYTDGDHKGFFKYIDPETKEEVYLNDDENMQDGWTVKVGYFGGHDEEDKQVWHSARTYDNNRLTLAYVIPDKYKKYWDIMVEDLTDG